MASINTSQMTGSSLDVASIVSQLMEIERKPLQTISAKIERAEVKISALGSFQSKLSALKDAVDRLQTPERLTEVTLSNSQPAVATATVGAGTLPGRYEVGVVKLAQTAVVNLLGGAPPLAEALDGEYYFKVGDTTTHPFSAGALSAGAAEAQIKAHFETLRDAFNSTAELKDRFRAVLVDAGGGQWGLSLQGLETGVANQLERVDASGNLIAASNFRAASDARVTINGIDYVRGSNAFEVAGLGLQLLDENKQTTLEVSQTSVGSVEAVQTLATAYNDLLAEYKSLTESNVDASLRGTLNSDSTLAAVMRQVNAQLMGDITSGSSVFKGVGALGLEFNDNGQLVYKPALIANSAALDAALSSGLYLGSSTSNLSTQLDDTLAFGGVLYERIDSEKELQRDLSLRQAAFEEKLQKVQERYTAQYAALDALLFRLNSTNTALKGALDALAAQNKSN